MAPSSGFSEKNSPRLIDYIVFVGQKCPSRSGRAISQPELLRVYPPQNHPDFALPTDIVYFCQPEGCYNTSSRSFILDPRHSGGRLPQNIKMEFFTFMLTDKDSNLARFGVCLNFLRPIGRRKSSYTADVARRRIAAFKNALQHPELKVENSRLRSCDDFWDSSSSSASSEFVGSQTIDKPERPYTHTLTSICLVSHYQFFKKFGSCLQFLYVLIQKLHEECKPRRSGRQTVWSVLTGAIESPALLTVRKSVEEIDTWILRLLSVPAPIAGKTAVYAYLQPLEFTPPLVFALPDENRFSLADYSLCLPLRLLGVEKFLKVFFALLLEQKVVLESSHHDRLTTCVMAFTALCYPLQYLFAVIPLLPSSLKGAEQLLQAPSPYIIGLPRNFRDSRLSFHLPKDVLLVDLDTQELYGQGAQDPIPKLPQNEEKKLISQLNRVLERLNGLKGGSVEEKEMRSPSDRTSIFDLNSFESPFHDLDEESLNLALRVVMVMFFKSPNVLGGFREYTRTVRIYPRPVVAFQYERFMKSRPEPSPFTVVLAKTQAVEYFAEWILIPDNLVYQKLDDESLLLVEIGDKDKWFSDTLYTIPFHLWTERFDRGLLRPVVELFFSSTQHNNVLPEWSVNKQLMIKPSPSATLSSTSGACEIITTSGSDTPTDVSASNGNSSADTDAEPTSDVESGKEISDKPQRSGGRDREETLFSSVTLSTPENVECMQFGKELPSNLRVYYSPPTSFVIHNSNSQPSATTPSLSPQDSLLSGHLLKEATQRLVSMNSANSGEPLSQAFDSPELLRASSSGLFTHRISDMGSPILSLRPSSPIGHSSQRRSSRSTLSAILDSWFADVGKSADDASDPDIEKQRMELEISENWRFISECIATIKKGNQPGIFSRRRLQKLMEEEMYRNSALALANMNVGHPVPKGQSHIADVFLDSWDQYKAYVWLFNQIGMGIRQSCRPLTTTFIDSRGDVVSAVGLAQAFRDLFTSQAERERVAHGGVCSAFCLLEMAHTHHHLLPKRRSAASQPPLVPHKVSQTPLAASVPTSRRQSIEVSISPRLKSDSEVQEKGFFTFTELRPNPPNPAPQQQHHQDANQFSFHYLRDMPDLVELSQKLQIRLADAFRSSLTTQFSKNGDSKEMGGHLRAYLTRETAIRLSQRLLASQGVLEVQQKPARSRTRKTRPFLHSPYTLDDESEMISTRWARQQRCQGVSSSSRELWGPDVTHYSSIRRRRNLHVARMECFCCHQPTPDSRKPFNVINPQNPTPSQPLSAVRQPQNDEHEGTDLTTSSGISMDMVKDVVLLSPFKSAVSLGYRYRHGRLFQMALQVSSSVKTLPPCISVPALRISLADHKSDNTTRTPSTASVSDGKDEKSEKEKGKEKEEIVDLKPEQLGSKIGHTYLFEEALINSTDSKLWTNMQFWEDLFLDTVAQERDLLGMNFNPEGLLEHYSHLTPVARKHLELSEDALLAEVMHNLIAFMVMARIPPDLICRKVRRLIAKSHTGLHYTQKITQLLDSLEWLRGNDIDLLPIASRQFTPETFSVYPAWIKDSEMLTMEIYGDFLLTRSPNGSVFCRWWFDQVINVTYSPMQYTIDFQTQLEKKIERFSFTSTDTTSLFASIASAISRARSKSPQGQIIEQLGGRVNVVDAETNAVGELDLNFDGFCLTFGGESQLIPFDRIKSCSSKMEDTFSFVINGCHIAEPMAASDRREDCQVIQTWERCHDAHALLIQDVFQQQY
uniref:MAP kinase-activating death domain protein n=1 Tax=Echinococcus canadensis TaxID=519352 RepID=A0A915EZQ0_9CEST